MTRNGLLSELIALTATLRLGELSLRCWIKEVTLYQRQNWKQRYRILVSNLPLRKCLCCCFLHVSYCCRSTESLTISKTRVDDRSAKILVFFSDIAKPGVDSFKRLEHLHNNYATCINSNVQVFDQDEGSKCRSRDCCCPTGLIRLFSEGKWIGNAYVFIFKCFLWIGIRLSR